MRIPHSIQGLVSLPLMAGIIFVLKSSCPSSSEGGCFADYFATIVFLPLVGWYKIVGSGIALGRGEEILFIFVYWAITGFIIGLILDLCTRPSQYLPSQRPPL